MGVGTFSWKFDHLQEMTGREAAKVVELRFFGGLSIEETSAELRLSSATVKRHWTVARAYLVRQLRDYSA